MRKITLSIFLVVCFALAAALVLTNLGVLPQKVSASMPVEACYNVATKLDEWVQKQVEYSYTTMQFNPCTGELEYNVTFQYGPSWTSRYRRYIFSDGSIMGGAFQGYFGGRVTYYTICTDGTAEVYGQSFGYYGWGARNVICDTLQ